MRLWLSILLVAAAMHVTASAAERTLSHGRFQNVHVYEPATPPQQFVMLLAGAAARDDAELAEALQRQGALVAVIDTPTVFAKFERDGGECVSPDGDLENLSHYIQAQQRLATYHTPILVGDGAAAAFVYAMLAQAPRDTFAGGISLHFCPELELRKSLCKDNRLDYSARANGSSLLSARKLQTRWTALNSATSVKCVAAATAFVQQATGATLTMMNAEQRVPMLTQAYANLAKNTRPSLAPPPQQVADLPLIEVPTKQTGDTFALMFSGDGGWAGLDKDVAASIAAGGIPVVGVDSLRYFWNERSPESLASDIARIVGTYTQRWQRKRVILIGYSQGADVLPFAINRLDARTRPTLASVVLIGLAERAMFEFHVGNWLGIDDDASLPTAPEMQRIRTTKLVCIYGEDDEDATCDAYRGSRVRVVKLAGGHHFDGDYEGLARVIVREASE